MCLVNFVQKTVDGETVLCINVKEEQTLNRGKVRLCLIPLRLYHTFLPCQIHRIKFPNDTEIQAEKCSCFRAKSQLVQLANVRKSRVPGSELPLENLDLVPVEGLYILRKLSKRIRDIVMLVFALK